MSKAALEPRHDHAQRPPGVPAVLPRRPTDPEWNELSAVFPNLIRNDVWITGEPTATYNCIAWSLGYTDRWINPPQPLAAFNQLYVNHGYAVTAAGAGSAIIDGWARLGTMTHGSRRYAGQAGLFESKLGQWYRISHNRNGVAGDAYGAVVVSYNDPRLGLITPHGRSSMKSLTNDELSALAQRVSGAGALRSDFAHAFDAWKATWGSAVDDTHELASGLEFERLVQLGEGILPLVVEKMVQPNGFPALVLYDRLAPDPTLVIRYTDDDPDAAEGEQSRALRSARLWLGSKG